MDSRGMGSTRWRPITGGVPRGQPWDQSSSTPISGMDDVSLMSNSSDPTLLMSPGCVVQLARQNEGVPSRGTWTGLRSGPKETP